MLTQALKRKREIFFTEQADSVLKFSNGKTIKVNSTCLAMESPVFDQLFQNAWKKKRRSNTSSVIEIHEFEYIKFVRFLECLIGVEECSLTNAVELLPIALKFETNHLKNKLLKILKPTELTVNVCLALNVAITFKCDELKEAVLKFLRNEKLMINLIDDADYSSLLEPVTVAELLQHIRIDSFVFENLFFWAENYLKKNNDPVDYKAFFSKHGILDKLTLTCFESAKALVRFNESEHGQNFFALEDFYFYLKNFKYDDRDSVWVDVFAGDTLVEKIVIKNIAFLKDMTVILRLFRNRVVFHEYPKEGEKEDVVMETRLSVKISEVDNWEKDAEILKEREDDVSDDLAELRMELNCDLGVISGVEVIMTTTFYYECRILKTNPSNFLPLQGSAEELFFIRSVDFSYGKEGFEEFF